MADYKVHLANGGMSMYVDADEVTRALGVLQSKTPAVLKVAVNRTARQARKQMLSDVEERYDLNSAGKRMIRDLKQRKRATNRSVMATLGIRKGESGSFRADLGYFKTNPTKPYMGQDAFKAPEYFRARVLKKSPLHELTGTDEKSKGFLVKFDSGHVGMVQRKYNEPTSKTPKANRWKNKNGIVEKLYTMSSPSGSAMHRTIWEIKDRSIVAQMLELNTRTRVQQIIATAKRKGKI